jgi:hypothetical protein
LQEQGKRRDEARVILVSSSEISPEDAKRSERKDQKEQKKVCYQMARPEGLDLPADDLIDRRVAHRNPVAANLLADEVEAKVEMGLFVRYLCSPLDLKAGGHHVTEPYRGIGGQRRINPWRQRQVLNEVAYLILIFKIRKRTREKIIGNNWCKKFHPRLECIFRL